MIRGFFTLIFRLAVLALIIFIGSAIWIVSDGLRDRGDDRTDIAVVPGMSVKRDGTPGPTLRTRLDGAILLYHQGHFPLIYVSGSSKAEGYDEAGGMAKYLEAHDVPASAIVVDPQGDNTRDTAQDLAKYMKWRDIHSVMIVTHYYHMTRTKLALKEAGITDITQFHVGVVQKEDASSLAREVVALYYYWFRFYLMPQVKVAEEKAKEEAPKMQDEIKKDADKAKDAVDNQIHSLPK